MTARTNQSGFTLIEMIVALAALSLLMVLLAGSVQFGARAWEGQSRRVAAYSDPDSVHSVLRLMLQNARTTIFSVQAPAQGAGTPPRDARPAPDTGADTNASAGEQANIAPFVGGPDSLEFIGEMPAGLTRGGLHDLRLWVKNGRLLLSWRPHGSADGTPYRDTELLSNVTTLELAYFAPPSGRQRGGWVSRWTRPGALPALIVVRVRFGPGDPQVWRELRAAPLIGSPLG